METLTVSELRDLLKAEIAAAPYRGTIARWIMAKGQGVRAARVYGFLRATEPPSASLLKVLGYELDEPRYKEIT